MDEYACTLQDFGGRIVGALKIVEDRLTANSIFPVKDNDAGYACRVSNNIDPFK
jgi:hypothetical protein